MTSRLISSARRSVSEEAGELTSLLPLYRRAICALFVLASTSAIAATDYIESYFKSFMNPQGEQNLRKHANCIAARYAPEVQAILRNDFGMKEITSDHRDLLNFKCSTSALFHENTITLSDLNYPQALAEAMLLRDYNLQTVSDVTRASPLKRDEFPTFDDDKLPQKFKESLELSRYFNKLDAIAECAARKQPQAVLSIFGTPLNSPTEATAINAVEPALADCGIRTLQLEPPAYFIRGALAKNLYRLADELHPIDMQNRLRGTEH